MARTSGLRSTRVGLIDGHVLPTHPGLADAHLEFLAPPDDPAPPPDDPASRHATSVAGILVARRGSGAPAICPDATLVVRPIFPSASPHHGDTAPPGALASAIVEAADAGVRILNLSLTLTPHSYDADNTLQRALDYAAHRGVIVVAAAGNHGAVGGSVLTCHRSVIPVVAYDLNGHPSGVSNLGPTIGRRGVGATGAGILSLEAGEGLRPFGGTSAAAALVTGAIALLWSEFPQAAPADLMFAVTRSPARRASVVPPLIDAWRAYETVRAARYG
ncbi:S8 family peptidase [Streptomyces sp. MI02-7b]|uniref:S8 family peptidase n=1 Tax=Streptomyces sp. MI02-7b TaxID=462941 RepID=UPI0029B27313|nr:S8 family serine peptidase [Streptomyces sp. MI02-7b]MDX3075759.1 S8 family serine peptidase [Streptomyces sp. MI02-7b]